MAEEFIYEREEELIDYFRNNLTDSKSIPRGTDIVDESFTATNLQTVFILEEKNVKNVADTITVEAVTKRKGRDYYVTYGQGSAKTIVTLRTGAATSDEVLISYHYGDSMISREYARDDTTVPRVIMEFLTGSEEYAGLGDAMEDGKGSYFNATYRFEIRAKFPGQARRLAAQAFNLGKKARHANLYRTLITLSRDLGNFGYDRDREVYIWQFSLDIQWDMLFE